MGYLIDTSIFVAWERGLLNGTEIDHRRRDEIGALSVITASELLHGVHRADSAQRRARRQTFVEAILDEFPVHPVDIEVSRIHARVWADLRSRGEIVGAHDLLIAATALALDFRVATRNAREFGRVDELKVEVW